METALPPLDRIFDLLPYLKSRFGNSLVFAHKYKGEWLKCSLDNYIEMVDKVSLALLALNVQKGDAIINISGNSSEFNYVDMGLLQTGAVHVPLSITIDETKLHKIVEQTQARVFFVSKNLSYQKVKRLQVQFPFIKHIITYEKLREGLCFRDFIETADFKNYPLLQERKSAVSSGDLSSIIYISGNSENIKGVAQTHGGSVSNLKMAADAVRYPASMRCLSLLPLSHSFGRTINYMLQYLGVAIYYNDSSLNLLENFQQIRPGVTHLVPLLAQRIENLLIQKTKDASTFNRHFVDWAVRLGKSVDAGKPKNGILRLKLAFADRFVFSKWRKLLGGQIDNLVCGGASLKQETYNLFAAVKIALYDGYGLTEAGPIVSCNSNFGAKPYTCGKPLKGIKLQIAADGEILVKSPGLMWGYYKNEEETGKTIVNGWLHTGDLGSIDSEGFLKITGTKKEIFKLSNGLYVNPVEIAAELEKSEYIRQALIAGRNEDFLSALIIPVNPELPNIHSLIDAEIENYNSVHSFSNQIQKHQIVDSLNDTNPEL